MTNCKPLKKFHVTFVRNETVRVFAEDNDSAVKAALNLHPTEYQAALVDSVTETVEADNGEAVQFGFEHAGDWIVNPTASPCGRFIVTPDYYGFTVEQTGGGCTAWRKDLPSDMYMLLTADDDADHKYGIKFALGLYDKLTDTGNAIDYRIMEVGVIPEWASQSVDTPPTVGSSTPDYMHKYFRSEVLALGAYTECGSRCVEVMNAADRFLGTMANVEDYRRMEIIAAASNECNVILFG